MDPKQLGNRELVEAVMEQSAKSGSLLNGVAITDTSTLDKVGLTPLVQELMRRLDKENS